MFQPIYGNGECRLYDGNKFKAKREPHWSGFSMGMGAWAAEPLHENGRLHKLILHRPKLKRRWWAIPTQNSQPIAQYWDGPKRINDFRPATACRIGLRP